MTPLSTKRETIGWVDALRVLACILVVLSHSCDQFIAQFSNDPMAFYTGVAWGSLVRPCVPLFAMMTGVLLLPVRREQTLGGFYCKRIGRLVIPLVFWSIVLPLTAWAYFNYLRPDTQNPCIDMATYSENALEAKLSTFVFNFNFDTTPLWYLYMLIGLYLIMPILSAWLRDASKRDQKIVLGIWAASLLVPYLKMVAPKLGYLGNFDNMGLFGECDWNAYTSFHYLSGFIGYLILANYLRQYPPQWSWGKMLAICIPMFLVGYAITSYGYVLMGEKFPGDYAYLEIIWLFCGANVFLMTLPTFLVVQKLNARPRPWLSRLAGLTFGIYLCHFTIISVAYDLYDQPGLPYTLRIILMAISTFSASAIVVWLLSLNRWTRRLIA